MAKFGCAGLAVLAALMFVFSFDSYDRPSFLGTLVLMAVFGLIGLWIGWSIELAVGRAQANNKGMDEWRRLTQGLRHAHSYKSSGIALDEGKEVIHLMRGAAHNQRGAPGPFIKSYPFDDIRKWRYNVQEGGGMMAIGNPGLAGALQVVGQERANKARNRAASGFFVEMKDIDYPEWQIYFADARLNAEVTRWMEIMRQVVNRD